MRRVKVRDLREWIAVIVTGLYVKMGCSLVSAVQLCDEARLYVGLDAGGCMMPGSQGCERATVEPSLLDHGGAVRP